MLEKLAKQTAVYGISTIVVRFLSYLLTPYYTRIFGQETYGIVTDIYALIPLALTLLTMGMESSYFRFSAKADQAGGDVIAAKRRLFATTWGVTSLAAALFCGAIIFFRMPVARAMGEAYAAHPAYVVLVALIVLFDVWACIPFSRLREQGRSLTFVGFKALNVVLNVALAFAFGIAGLFASDFGVGWVFVANLIASAVTWLLILSTVDRTVPHIDRALLAAVFVYSLPLLVGGLAGTANEFIDRQLIKYLVPAGAMAQLGVYGAITKIAVVMMLFYQMYRLAAEPFFLSNFRKSDFVEMNAAALKYYVMASMLIFLGIALFRDFFALIVGRDFREGIHILPRSVRRWPSSLRAPVWPPCSFPDGGSSPCGVTSAPPGPAWSASPSWSPFRGGSTGVSFPRPTRGAASASSSFSPSGSFSWPNFCPAASIMRSRVMRSISCCLQPMPSTSSAASGSTSGRCCGRHSEKSRQSCVSLTS